MPHRLSGLLLAAMLATGGPAFAAGDLTRQEPTAVTATLGTPKGEHRFTPDALTFETGRLYVLRLENPTANAYYFGSEGLADSVDSRKVVALGGDGKPLAEVYGPVRRVELRPAASSSGGSCRFASVGSTTSCRRRRTPRPACARRSRSGEAASGPNATGAFLSDDGP
jgi:hypothetical protein